MTTATQTPARLDTKANKAAASLLAILRGMVETDLSTGLVPSPHFDAYEAAASVLESTFQAFGRAVAEGHYFASYWERLEMEEKWWGCLQVEDADGPLKLASVHLALDQQVWVTFSEDGLDATGLWHEGPSIFGERRYVRLVFERTGWTVVRRSHGFVDATTRRITQTG